MVAPGDGLLKMYTLVTSSLSKNLRNPKKLYLTLNFILQKKEGHSIAFWLPRKMLSCLVNFVVILGG